MDGLTGHTELSPIIDEWLEGIPYLRKLPKELMKISTDADFILGCLVNAQADESIVDDFLDYIHENEGNLTTSDVLLEVVILDQALDPDNPDYIDRPYTPRVFGLRNFEQSTRWAVFSYPFSDAREAVAWKERCYRNALSSWACRWSRNRSRLPASSAKP